MTDWKRSNDQDDNILIKKIRILELAFLFK